HIKKTLETKANRIGSKYSKFVFRLYTDGNYTQEIKSPASQGYVGPLLRGEVGEVIRVRFRNDIHIPVSVHPHGVRYTKVNEGALYADGTNATSKVDDGVSPGSEYTYVWELTSDFAPRDDDPRMLSAAGSRNDVDSEHVLYFDSILEGNSWLVAENLKRCVDPDECKRLYESGDEKESEKYFAKTYNGKPMIGGTYRKSRFNEYTSTAFNTHASKSTHERHLGLLGPVIRAEVGDTVNVTLRNLTPYPVSIAFQGVSVSMSMNGFCMYQARVNSGGLGFYTFTVPWGVGPGDDDPPCLTYIYYSDVNMERDVNSGLVAINGFSYGNLEGLSLCRYENVVWHVLSFGSTESLHVVTFNGNNVVIDGRSRDSHVIISGQAFNAFMKPDNDGTWSLHCHNSVEYNAGMTALYHVEACGSPNPPPFLERTGRTRRNMHILVQKDGQFVGSIYTKAFYREFTDETFASEKQRTADEVHLGIQGPMIKAEVGDVVEVVFKNMASRPYSIHAQGLRYNSSYEGMAYADGQPVTSGDGVTPGATFTYRWEVPFTAAPSGNGPNCVNFLYYSAVNLDKDIFSGLAGTIVVCRKGILNDDGSRSDSIEKEFSLLFVGYYETHSWYLSQNIQENCPGADTTTKEFLKSNIYASVNGYIFNNVKGLTMQSGDNVAWYISALGKEGDTHTVHFHGQTYIYRTDQTHEGDVIEVFPGTYETVEMYASNPGTWLIHCHVGLHMVDGMIATYTVE
ncbi:HEPHL-like protein, partial [Mya arenaria]